MPDIDNDAAGSDNNSADNSANNNAAENVGESASVSPPEDRCKCAWLHPLRLAALLLVIVFAALIIHNEHRKRSSAELLPTETEFYFIAPIANEPTAPALEKFALWDDLRHEFFGVLPLEMSALFTRVLTHYGVAQLPEGRALIVQCANAWEVEKLFASPEFARAALPTSFPDDFEIQINGHPLYFVMLKPYAVFSPSREILAEIIACWRQTLPSLNRIANFSGGSSRKSADFFWRLSNGAIGDKFGKNFIAAPENPTENLAIAGTITWNKHNFSTTGKIVDLSAPLEPVTHGVFYYTLWTLAVIVIIAVAAPFLFLFAVFAVAVWFHIDSKIRGINCPQVAPQLPPLSPELTEDLAASPAVSTPPESLDSPASENSSAPASSKEI